MSSRLLSSLKGYASSSRSQQGSGSSAGGSGGSHRARLFSGWGGGDGAGEGASEVPHDPGFDDAKRKWGELDEFFTTVYQAYLQATTGIIDVARPLNRLESTVRDYFDDQEAESRVVRRFSSSVVKLNVATMRFEEVLEEGRVQADLEEWILKLEEIKRDIEARERLYSEFVREKKSWNHAHQKAEHKRMTDDPATIAKLNRLESAWQAAHEGFKRTNKKIILSVNELSTQVKPALQEYLQALGVAQYGLYHTLNVAYAEWQEDDDPQSAPSIIPVRVKAGSNSTRASMASPQKSLPATPAPAPAPTSTPTSPTVEESSSPAPPSPTTVAAAASPETDQPPRDDQPNPVTPATTPVAQQSETSTSATSSAPTPSASITPTSVGSPVPPPKTNMQERLSMLKQRNSAAAKPLPKTPPSTGETPAGASATPAPAPSPSSSSSSASASPSSSSSSASPSSSSGQGGEMERRLEEQERWELGKQSERLAAEWRELEAAQALLARRQRDEAEALQREKQALEESRREAQAQARRAQQQLDEERALLDESKRELARQLELAEQREQGRVQIEQEFVRMQEERRLLEDRKREVREQKMKRRLEEEWKKIEEARRELLELRQAEHARTMEAQAEQVRAEQQRLAAEAEERRQREEAQREDEAREHERLQRIRRQMDDERRKLDRSLRTLGHLDADDDDAHDGVLEFSGVFARPAPPPATHAAAADVDNGEAKEGESGDAGDGEATRAAQHKSSEVEPKVIAPTTKATQEAEEKVAEVKSTTEEAADSTTASVDDGRPHSDEAGAPAAAVEAAEAPKASAAEEGGRFVAVREYVAAEEGELGLQPGYEVQHVDGGPDDQWWIGVLIHPASADEASRPMGIFPSAAVVPKGAPTTLC